MPTYVFKAVLDPRSRSAAAYVAENTEDAAWTAISIAQLTRLIGINVFPTFSPGGRDATLRLPEPTPHGYGGDRPYPKRSRMP